MKRKIITIMFAIVTMIVQAQKVTFVSEGFMAGIKNHLGLGDTDEVMQTQTDTITVIDLSGREIADISDVAYLTNVTWIDLSENKIEDVSPLTSLEHLQYVNLRRNALEDINPLAFACTDSLHVNIAENYIKDYDYLFSVTSCHLLLEGMGAQQEKNAPYFDVYQLYADVNNDGTTRACYRGYTNMEAGVTLRCEELNASAVMDGYTNSVTLPYDLDATTQIVLSNGEVGDTTYVVPPAIHIVEGGGEVTVDTELPESYQIGYLRALHGTVESNGTTLHYVAPSPLEADTLYVSYYEGSRIKGFTQMYFMSQDFIDKIKAPQQDRPLKVSLHDGVLNIAELPTQGKAITDVKVYDALGRMLATEISDNQQSMSITLQTSPSVVIVEVSLSNAFAVDKHIVTKVAAK